MITEEFVKILISLTRSSYLWGPFFFSLLFMLVITRKAHNYLHSINTRAEPPADIQEKKVYTTFFRATCNTGIILVFISVGWWLYAQFKLHSFEGMIVNVNAYQTIVPSEDDIYIRSIQRKVGPGISTQDFHFAVVSKKPFIDGQSFNVNYFLEKEGNLGLPPDPIVLKVSYNGDLDQKYILKKDGDSYFLSYVSNGDK